MEADVVKASNFVYQDMSYIHTGNGLIAKFLSPVAKLRPPEMFRILFSRSDSSTTSTSIPPPVLCIAVSAIFAFLFVAAFLSFQYYKDNHIEG